LGDLEKLAKDTSQERHLFRDSGQLTPMMILSVIKSKLGQLLAQCCLRALKEELIVVESLLASNRSSNS